MQWCDGFARFGVDGYPSIQEHSADLGVAVHCSEVERCHLVHCTGLLLNPWCVQQRLYNILHTVVAFQGDCGHYMWVLHVGAAGIVVGACLYMLNSIAEHVLRDCNSKSKKRVGIICNGL